MVARSRWSAAACTLGALSNILIGDLTELPTAEKTFGLLGPTRRRNGAIGLVVVLLAVCAGGHRRRRLVTVLDRDAPFGTVVAVPAPPWSP
ncbi:hypothetical protein ACIBQ0_10105 [Nocardia nova]|uniref:hypothetical protein n=1 Tax=Nocardia nova TaxID=37330 RepID=UPI0037BAAE39